MSQFYLIYDTMFQSMTEQLAGNFPLQRMIINDYLSYGTPSSRAMRPLIEEMQQKIRENPDKPADEMTAWRCRPKRPMCNSGHCSFRGFVLETEINLMRISSIWEENTTPFLVREKSNILTLVQNADLNQTYNLLL
jgi:hypothetical protein